ncbi:MAG: hypothetical protein Q9163_002771 [Psora crenata]
MKINSFVDGIAVISLIAGELATTAAAAHAHHHGEIIGRIMHKSKASSGSSSSVTTVDSSNGPSHPQATISVVSVRCLHDGCDAAGAIFEPVPLTHATPVPQELHTQALHLQQVDTQATPTRRWTQSRPRMVVPAGELFAELNDPAQGTQQGEKDLRQSAYEHGRQAEHGSLQSIDFAPHALEARQDDSYESFVLEPYPQPTSTSAIPVATATTLCPTSNGTTYTSAAGVDYQVVCDIDFKGNDFPFQNVSSFQECVEQCDALNDLNGRVFCLGALYVPSREGTTEDCYLKSSVSDPVFSTFQIEGAIRLQEANTTSISSSATATATKASSFAQVSSTSLSTSTIAVSSAAVTELNSSASSALGTKSSTSEPTAAYTSIAPAGSGPGVTYASGDSVIPPKIASAHLHGPSLNIPSKQYVNYEVPKGIELANSLLTIGVNGDLTTGYDISPQTGVLDVNISTQSLLGSLSGTPHLSRDGGQGGMINGQHLFVFCDTGTYTTATSSANGQFLGFVSSSVAIDTGMNGLLGNALNLQDGIGEWSDDVGRMRGFAPLTDGEQAYNQAMQGNGQRYAIWPESPIIPIDATSGIMYAPIVYDNVNRETEATVFTYTGATLLTITAGGKGGPVAERTVKKIFDQDEIEWGCAGGFRSWGPSGIGGDDGSVYIFGNIQGGILLGRTSPAQVSDRTSFEYWDGSSWTNQMPTTSSKAFFIEGPFMDVNIFYSPRHLTFIIVYLTVYADSTFYYRYLQADQGILPSFAPGAGSSSDYFENVLQYKWSEEQVLYKSAQGLSGKYIYAGAVHEGYYGSNDITNGGSKMLISWTAPTGQDPSSINSEYQIITAEIDWT